MQATKFFMKKKRKIKKLSSPLKNVKNFLPETETGFSESGQEMRHHSQEKKSKASSRQKIQMSTKTNTNQKN